MNNIAFTQKEVEIFKAWLLNKKNNEIAAQLRVTDAYISQTIKKIKEKMHTLQNSINLLEEMGLIEPITPLKLTEEGKISLKARGFLHKTPEKTEMTGHKDIFKTPVESLGTISPIDLVTGAKLARPSSGYSTPVPFKFQERFTSDVPSNKWIDMYN